MVHARLALRILDRPRGAVMLAATAPRADVLVAFRFDLRVLHELAGPARPAHTEVLQVAAKSGGFMTLEMGECDDRVRLGQSRGDLHLAQFARGFQRHGILAEEAVGDDERRADRGKSETITGGGEVVIHRVRTAAFIQGIGIC